MIGVLSADILYHNLKTLLLKVHVRNGIIRITDFKPMFEGTLPDIIKMWTKYLSDKFVHQPHLDIIIMQYPRRKLIHNIT